MKCSICENQNIEHMLLHLAECKDDERHFDAFLPLLNHVSQAAPHQYAFEIVDDLVNKNMLNEYPCIAEIKQDVHSLASLISRMIVLLGFDRRKRVGALREKQRDVFISRELKSQVYEICAKSISRVVKTQLSSYFREHERLAPVPMGGHIVEITKIFSFAAAHHLPNHPRLCKYTHGHEWELEVTVVGVPDNSGMVLDFSDLKAMVATNIISVLDHNYVNDLIWNPTAENLCMWVIDELYNSGLTNISRVKLWEAKDSFAELSAQRLFVGNRMAL